MSSSRFRILLFIRLLLFWRLQGRNGVAGELDFYILRYTELYAISSDSYYRTVNPAARDDLISALEVVDHLLDLLLTPASREENNKVENPEDKNER